MLEIIKILFSYKIIIIVIAFSGAVVSWGISKTLTPLYRATAEVSIISENNSKNLLGLAQGVPGLAALGFGGVDSAQEEVIAILKSFNSAMKFIENNNLERVIMEGDDATAVLDEKLIKWRATETLQDSILSINEDPVSGIVRISVLWKDPKQAKEWVDKFILQMENKLKDERVEAANNNLEYLAEQIRNEKNPNINSTLSRLYLNEINDLMLIKSGSPYKIQVISPALEPPLEEKVWPRGIVFAFLGGLIGGILSVGVALLLNERKVSRSEKVSV